MSKRKTKVDIERDYKDICYFIDHVKDIKFRIDLIKSLGYKIGVNVAKVGDTEKKVTIGKQKEHRIQLTPIVKCSPLVVCAIVE